MEISPNKKAVSINAIYVDFSAGTDVNDAMAEMYHLHMSKQADIETVFNEVRIIVADNKMIERFGYTPLRKINP